MVPTRRQLLATGSATLVAGCISRPPDSETDGTSDDPTDGGTPTDDQGLPSDLRAALAPLPASVAGESTKSVRVSRPGQRPETGDRVASVLDAFGLDRSAVQRVGIASDQEASIVVTLVGSFAAADAADPGRFASEATDGRVIGATHGGNEPWQAGLDAALAARDSPDAGVLAVDPMADLFDPLAEAGQVRALVDPSGDALPSDVDPATVDGLAVGITPTGGRTHEVTFVTVFADGAAATEATLRSLFAATFGEIEIEDASVDGRRGVATGVYEARPSPSRGASPDAKFDVSYDDGTATVEHAGGESIPAAELALRVDGDPAPVAWAGEYNTVSEGDSLTFEAAPFAYVAVRWEDPDDEATFDVLGQAVLSSRDAFEAVYDPAAGELTITYRGARPADTSGLRLDRQDADQEGADGSTEVPLADRYGTLTAGDRIVLEDVDPGDSVTVVREVEREWMSFAASVFTFTVHAPGRFRLGRKDGTTFLEYRGSGEGFVDGVDPADPGRYRVLVDGEPAASQWAEDGTLATGDRLTVEADPGQVVTVEWTGDGGTVETFSSVVVPRVDFEFDVREDVVEVTHAGGEPVDAGRLAIEFRPEREDGPVSWEAAGERIEDGDSITVDRPDGARGVVVTYEGRRMASEWFGE